MKIAYFPTQLANNAGPVINAIITGCKNHGISLVADSMDADAAIIWSVLWNGRMAKNQQVYEHYQKNKRPVIVIDIGTLIRGVTWKIARDNITSFGYYGHTENLDWDRPARLNVQLSQSTGNHILIAAQHRKSLQLDGIDLESWINQQIINIRQHTDRPIYIRPHPRCKLNLAQLPNNVKFESPQPLPNTYDSFDIDYQCHAVVNYNSGPGIQAAIAGTRPIVDASSLAHPVSIDVAMIEQPYDIDRQQWLVEICHTEYTLNEIEQGIWIPRLKI